ncbi:NYN domain-containing protein [Candidatus Aerophobetes bacterium]|uniref:NYN domain-containing protein n=1 Tax=Aerophobetes bacterium TaxID=2030807 RepID=A0A523W5A6_UNCAE|nr:MAG: NYN domain-containing protein [Candidatus Aerophobetes bacterium]
MQMNRVLFLIDGFNIYHSLDNRSYSKYKWLDYSALARCFVTSKDKVVRIVLFTAYAYWNLDKVKRHKKLIQAVKSRGVEIVEGKFKKKDVYITVSKGQFTQKNVVAKLSGEVALKRKSHEEKLTDVNIAVQLLQSAIRDEFDTAVLMTADTDLLPAIQAAKDNFPGKRIRVIFPIGRYTRELHQLCRDHARIKERHLKTCQLPDTVTVDSTKGIRVRRPTEWT